MDYILPTMEATLTMLCCSLSYGLDSNSSNHNVIILWTIPLCTVCPPNYAGVQWKLNGTLQYVLFSLFPLNNSIEGVVLGEFHKLI